MESVKLGILGMGTVASGLVNIIEFNNSKIINAINKKLLIQKVLVGNLEKKRNVNLPQEVYTSDAYQVINDQDTEIIVELMGGINPAYDYIKAALDKKKHVVTANKALIATHGKELQELADKNNVKLLYEASVAGGIPILNTIRDNLTANEFEWVYGIINGTTNYILTQMAEKGWEYSLALKEAQKLGFAEADPSSDVDGDDAAYKLAILVTFLFNQRVNLADISKEGITKISNEDIQYAKELGYNIKLLAMAVKKDNELDLSVQPAFIPENHPLSTVKNEFNAVFLKANALGELMLYGRGAGSLPTGSAVLGDIINLIKNTASSVSISEKSCGISNKSLKKYFIRMEVIDKPDTIGQIASIFGKNGISLANISQKQKSDSIVPLLLTTYESERKNIDLSLDEIKNLDIVSKVKSVIMIEDFK